MSWKTLEKSGLEPTAPNRLADRKHCALSTQPNPHLWFEEGLRLMSRRAMRGLGMGMGAVHIGLLRHSIRKIATQPVILWTLTVGFDEKASFKNRFKRSTELWLALTLFGALKWALKRNILSIGFQFFHRSIGYCWVASQNGFHWTLDSMM